MKKLVRVVRSSFNPDFIPQGDHQHAWRRRLPQAILPTNDDLNPDRNNLAREAEFFLVEAEDVDLAMRTFAEANPGCEVQIYALEASAQCPAAPMVVKTVTKDGVLPA